MIPATLQAPIHTTDTVGGEVEAWGAPVRIIADARQISSRRKLAADLPLTDTIWTIKIRYRPGVTRGHRITLHRGAERIPLDIICDPEDQGGRRQWLILTAQTGTAEAMTQQVEDYAAVAGIARTRAQVDAELDALRALLGTSAPTVASFALPGETLAANGDAIMARALAAGLPALRHPAGSTINLSAAITLTGMALYGGGTLAFSAGNVRMGTGSTLLDCAITGSARTNNASGVSVLADSAGALIAGNNISGVSLAGVNISVRSSSVRVLRNTISDTGGGSFDREYQASGIYASTASNLEIIGNNISRTRGDGGVHLHNCSGWVIDRNVIEDTHWRGVNCTGANTGGKIRSNMARRIGAENPGTSAVGCNGYFVADTADVWDVIAHDNDAEHCAENLWEGRAAWLSNRGHHSGAYPALASPSKEGLYLVAGGVAIGNNIADTVGAGIYCYSAAGANRGPEVRGNTIARPGGSGVRVLTDGGTLTGTKVSDNIVTATNAALRGYELTAINGGGYSETAITGNTLTGRVLNTIPPGATVSGNSWQTT